MLLYQFFLEQIPVRTTFFESLYYLLAQGLLYLVKVYLVTVWTSCQFYVVLKVLTFKGQPFKAHLDKCLMVFVYDALHLFVFLCTLFILGYESFLLDVVESLAYRLEFESQCLAQGIHPCQFVDLFHKMSWFLDGLIICYSLSWLRTRQQ